MAKIYTVVLSTESGLDSPGLEVLGSYRKVDDARNAVATYIIYRMECDQLFWDCLFSDENHEEMGEKLMYMVYIKKDGVKKLLRGSRDELRRYLMRELRCDGYYVFSTADGIDRSYHFNIIKNNLEE